MSTRSAIYRTTTGEYLGDPFRGGPRTLWNLPVVVSTAVGSGTVLVGAFKTAANRVTRGGLTVEAANTHSDFLSAKSDCNPRRSSGKLCVYTESRAS
jgi:HK97 family phage major capsid protein